ncbi:MAG: hypothetical protein IKO56_01645 [Alphaproteobacteria bacterium]|nr:hypothetical protein [Alphaproteobacteria bacterium]
MGEWSKKIGEYGKNVVEKFLSIIGWNNVQKGIEIKCFDKGHKSIIDKPAQTHGIDFLYSYKSPLVSGQLNNVIISSKFKTEKYPNSATATFKSFMTDLINTVECFDKSDTKYSILQVYNAFSSINDVGVLFWLNDQKESNDDLISMVVNAKIDADSDKTIYIMDNKRVAFIVSLITYVKSMNDCTYTYNFFYPSTGRNINPVTRTEYGAILPVEYVNSSVIPLRLENKNNNKEVSVFLGCIDDFELDTVMRLMGLAKDISKDWTGNVIIGFHDYNKLYHKNIVAEAKQGFHETEFTQKVSVVNYFDTLNVY